MPYSIKNIGKATATQAGLMSAEDKRRLTPVRMADGMTLFSLAKDTEISAETWAACLGPDVTPDVLGQCAAGERALEFTVESTDSDGIAAQCSPVPVEVIAGEYSSDGQPVFVAILSVFTTAISNLGGDNVLASCVAYYIDGAFAMGFSLADGRLLSASQYSRATSRFSASSMGLCPQAPSADAAQKFLRGDGQWAAPPEPEILETDLSGLFARVHAMASATDGSILLKFYDKAGDTPVGGSVTLPVATQTTAGLLSAADKQKLDSLPAEGGSGGGEGEEGDTLPVRLRVFPSGDPFPYIGDGYASSSDQQLNSTLDPATLFPFEGKTAEWAIRGSGNGRHSGGPVRGTFGYSVEGTNVTAFLDISGTGSMPWHYRRSRVGQFTQAADGTFPVTWFFPWITPEEQ